MTTTAASKQVRVAAYCRKSHAQGLEQEFNSLDAQRESIEAFVFSQRGAGMVMLPTKYDDGGFTGANIDRPGFQRLLADVAAGKVDCIAVYRLDRLSRSLADYVGLLQLFEKHGVKFVSVNEQFNTTTSIGRLVLHQLISFAQFERETISERIRDKIQATRRRGAWTGGRPILGYDVVDKKLAVNVDEAAQVRATFQLYLERGSLRAVVEELTRRAWRNKTGARFRNGSLYALLTNALYTGQMRAGQDLVPGAHEAIIDSDVWDAVQARLRKNGTRGGSKARNKTGALLRGLVRCGRCGSAMTHTFTKRGSKRYRYYTCTKAHTEGTAACPNCRVAAGQFEQFVADQIRAMGNDEALLARTAESAERLAGERIEQLAAERRRLERRLRRDLPDNEQALAQHRLDEVTGELSAIGDGTVDAERLRAALSAFAPVWDQLFPAEQERILRLLIEHITYDPDTGDVAIELRPCGIDALADEATETP